MKASPPAALEMTEANFLFQFEIVALNAPSQFCCAHKMGECDIFPQCR
jgi:hypothetical protein